MQRSLQKMIRNRLTTVQRIEVANDRLGGYSSQMSSRERKVRASSSFFRQLTATSRALTRDSGATRESTKEAMSLRAIRL